jgi:ubiquinone/menaquinone biosynthesis C-methylase UbiE
MKAANYYNGIAPGYNELYSEEQLNKWKTAKKLIEFSKNDIVLDIGCGTGIIEKQLVGKIKLIVGIDLSSKMLELAYKHPKITYLCSKASHLPFLDNTFDKVISITVLQDIKNWGSTLREIKRVAKGPVLISILKRKRTLPHIKKTLSKYFKIKKCLEEEKDYIFLLH